MDRVAAPGTGGLPQHGWQPLGLPQLVTRVDGPVVHEIGGRPARQVFEEHFRHHGPPHDLVWEMPGGHYSAGAFGLIEPDGSLLIRARSSTAME